MRQLVRSPGFVLVTIALLALGIGANTAIFSLLAAALTGTPPGIVAPERLVVFTRTGERLGFAGFSYPDYCDYRDRAQSFTGLMAYHTTKFSIRVGDEPEQVTGAEVTPNYFPVLGAGSEIHDAVVLSEKWRGAPGLSGPKTVRVNGRPYAVAALAPVDFRGTEIDEPLDVWAPLDTSPGTHRPDAFSDPGERGDAFLTIVGRLKPGVSVEQAQAEVATIARQLQTAYPKAYPEKRKRTQVILDRHVAFGPLGRDIAGGVLLVILAAAGFVLLIACFNIATVLLARASTRRREMAVRLALGAGRARLVRRLLGESLALSAAGGAIGLLLAAWGVRLLLHVSTDLAFLHPRLDARVFAFTALLSIATGILFGLVPAFESSRRDIVLDLRGSGTPSRRESTLRSMLVMSEVALSMVLSIGAALLVKSFRNVTHADERFVSGNVLLMSIDPERLGYSEPRRVGLYRDLYERLNGMPGIVSATLAERTLLSEGFFTSEYVPEGVTPSHENSWKVHDDAIAPRYFETLRIPLVAGREFTMGDVQGARGVAIVNEALAARVWPGRNPIGQRLRRLGFGVGPPLEVVGIARNVRRVDALDDTPLPYVYVPLFQQPPSQARLHIRTAGAANGIVRMIRGLDKELPVFDVKTLDRYVHDELALLWSLAALVSGFGVMALSLASIGLYGVISYSLAQRTREIGVRVALGAQRRDILKLILGQSIRLVAGGAIAGVLGAFALTRILREALYGVMPTDPTTYVGVTFLFVLVGLAAAYFPAQRALRIDPAGALRDE